MSRDVYPPRYTKEGLSHRNLVIQRRQRDAERTATRIVEGPLSAGPHPLGGAPKTIRRIAEHETSCNGAVRIESERTIDFVFLFF